MCKKNIKSPNAIKTEEELCFYTLYLNFHEEILNGLLDMERPRSYYEINIQKIQRDITCQN